MATLMTGYAESGLSNPKFVRRRLSDGAWWNTSGTPAFQSYNAANIASYGIAGSETGATGVYTATDPADTTAGDFLLVAAAGASLAVADVAGNQRWQDACGPLGVDLQTIKTQAVTCAAGVTVLASVGAAAAPGAAGGMLIAGGNAATTFATLTSTGAFSVNGVPNVSQTGDSYARLGAPAGTSVSNDIAFVRTAADDTNLSVGAARRQLATTGAAGSITLDGAAPSTNDLYKGCLIRLYSGTGAGQVRLITAYDGATLTATVSPNWTVTPDATSAYAILPSGPADVRAWAGSVPNALISGRVDANTQATAAALTFGLTGNITGNLSGSVGSVTGLTASNLDATISSRMATYTQPTGFLAATFPGTVASTTNISGGTITTVTNLTNAATAGDFTAAMKTSLDAATPVASIGTGGITSASFAAGATIPRVTLADTLTTYTSNVPQSGDAYARIGATGSGLTSLAPSATALSTAVWTSARAGYQDNLNVGGPVASQADINALNESASRTLILQTVPAYERPESGTTLYTVEARTFSKDTGSPVNADSTPTLTATGNITGNLSGNLSAAANPATGVYQWTYTVASTATLEQVTMGVSAVLAAVTYSMNSYTQVADTVSATFTSTDQANLTAIYNKLPVNNMGDQTLLAAAIGTPMQAYTQPAGFLAATFPGTVASPTNITTVGAVTSPVVLPTMPTDWVSAAGVSAAAVAKIQDGLATPTNITAGTITLVETVTDLTNAPANGDLTATMKTSVENAVWDTVLASHMTPGSTGERLFEAGGSGTPPTVAEITAGVTAQITIDHGPGSYERNTQPLTAAETRAAVGLAAASLDTQLEQLTWVKNFLGGDRVIDITATPWEEVVYVSGTATELTRKILRDVNGTDIGSTSTVIGRATES